MRRRHVTADLLPRPALRGRDELHLVTGDPAGAVTLPVDVGAQVLTADGAIGDGLDPRASLQGNGPLVVEPLLDLLRVGADGTGKTTLPLPQMLDCSVDRFHDADPKAMLYSNTSIGLVGAASNGCLSRSGGGRDHATMLTPSELRDRLERAIADAPNTLTRQVIADETGVSIQAVGGWLKTGRIHKRHFPKLAHLTGKPLAYFHGEDLAPPADINSAAAVSDELRPSSDTLRAALIVTERVLARAKVVVPPEAQAEIVLAVYDLIREGHAVQQAERTVSIMLRAFSGATVTD